MNKGWSCSVSRREPYLSVVSPVYMAEGTLDQLCQRLDAVLRGMNCSYEIILVCDGSPDGSWNVLERLVHQYDHLSIVRLSRNFGQHYALTAGLDLARGDWVVVIDCDLQDRPEDIPALVSKAEEGFDIVLARRIDKQHGIWKRLGSQLFARTFSLLSGHRIDSSVGSFRLLSRKVVDEYCKMRETYRLFAGLVEWLGFDVDYVNVKHAPRYDGKSSYNLHRLLRMALDGMISFSNRPLYLSVALGMLLFLLSGAYGTYLILSGLMGAASGVPGWLSTMTATVFLGALILLNQGVLGIYLGRLYNQTKGRPLYVIDRVVHGQKQVAQETREAVDR